MNRLEWSDASKRNEQYDLESHVKVSIVMEIVDFSYEMHPGLGQFTILDVFFGLTEENIHPEYQKRYFLDALNGRIQLKKHPESLNWCFLDE